MEKIPEPKVLTLDPNDENIILGIPDEDPDPNSSELNEPVKEKKVSFFCGSFQYSKKKLFYDLYFIINVSTNFMFESKCIGYDNIRKKMSYLSICCIKLAT